MKNFQVNTLGNAAVRRMLVEMFSKQLGLKCIHPYCYPSSNEFVQFRYDEKCITYTQDYSSDLSYCEILTLDEAVKRLMVPLKETKEEFRFCNGLVAQIRKGTMWIQVGTNCFCIEDIRKIINLWEKLNDIKPQSAEHPMDPREKCEFGAFGNAAGASSRSSGWVFSGMS
jgi:hypothetical protein